MERKRRTDWPSRTHCGVTTFPMTLLITNKRHQQEYGTSLGWWRNKRWQFGNEQRKVNYARREQVVGHEVNSLPRTAYVTVFDVAKWKRAVLAHRNVTKGDDSCMTVVLYALFLKDLLKRQKVVALHSRRVHVNMNIAFRPIRNAVLIWPICSISWEFAFGRLRCGIKHHAVNGVRGMMSACILAHEACMHQLSAIWLSMNWASFMSSLHQVLRTT